MLKRVRMSRTRSLAKNTLLIAISKISTQSVLFFMLPLYTASLSTSEYGAVDLIITYGGLFAPLIMLNVQQAVFRNHFVYVITLDLALQDIYFQ
jgi:O-antigen/teichoic acid export membrane protein